MSLCQLRYDQTKFGKKCFGPPRGTLKNHVKGALSRYSVIFCRFFAAVKWRRSHRGRTRSDQSRRRPGKNPSIAIARPGLREREWESKACDMTFVAKASLRLSSCTCFSSSCYAEVPSIFFLVLPLPGRHTTDRTLAQCRFECPGPRLPFRRSALVKSSSWRCPPNRGQRQERLDWPELITVLVKARGKCCHLTDSCLYLLRERKG